MSDAEGFALDVACPTCAARPRHACVAPDGVIAASSRVALAKPHLPRVVEGLRAALAEAEKERNDLGAALDAALRTSDYGKEKLVTVMQRRYGREARQWQANHDQRKTERDEALARAQALEKENVALSKVYGVAACLRVFPVPFNDHWALISAADACRQVLHDAAYPADRQPEDEIP